MARGPRQRRDEPSRTRGWRRGRDGWPNEALGGLRLVHAHPAVITSQHACSRAKCEAAPSRGASRGERALRASAGAAYSRRPMAAGGVVVPPGAKTTHDTSGGEGPCLSVFSNAGTRVATALAAPYCGNLRIPITHWRLEKRRRRRETFLHCRNATVRASMSRRGSATRSCGKGVTAAGQAPSPPPGPLSCSSVSVVSPPLVRVRSRAASLASSPRVFRACRASGAGGRMGHVAGACRRCTGCPWRDARRRPTADRLESPRFFAAEIVAFDDDLWTGETSEKEDEDDCGDVSPSPSPSPSSSSSSSSSLGAVDRALPRTALAAARRRSLARLTAAVTTAVSRVGASTLSSSANADADADADADVAPRLLVVVADDVGGTPRARREVVRVAVAAGGGQCAFVQVWADASSPKDAVADDPDPEGPKDPEDPKDSPWLRGVLRRNALRRGRQRVPAAAVRRAIEALVLSLIHI